MAVKKLPRTFKYGQIVLDDPGMDISPEKVRMFYAGVYPELSTAVVEGPKTTADAMEYEFVLAAGVKGVSVLSLAAGKIWGLQNKAVMDKDDLRITAQFVRGISQSRREDEVILPPSEAQELI